MRIDLRVRYLCGRFRRVRTDIDLPAELASAPRTPDNDRRIIDYITTNYRVERWACSRHHRPYTMYGFDRILEIIN